MASSERGTKRIDPDTGKKFYDLNMDPIVSPYTGKSYPRSYFEQVLAGKPSPALARKVDDEDEDEAEEEVEDVAAPRSYRSRMPTPRKPATKKSQTSRTSKWTKSWSTTRKTCSLKKTKTRMTSSASTSAATKTVDFS